MVEINFYDEDNNFLFTRQEEFNGRFDKGDIIHTVIKGLQKSYKVVDSQLIASFRKPDIRKNQSQSYRKAQSQPYIRILDRHYQKVWVKELESKKSDKSLLECSPHELNDEQQYIASIHFHWLQEYIDKGLITKGQLKEIRQNYINETDKKK